MKKNLLFEQCLSNVAQDVREEVRLNMDIANKIHSLLKARKLTQREFARMMGKRESEISRWLTGSRGFTTSTLAKISAVLGEPVVEVKNESKPAYVFIPLGSFVTPAGDYEGMYVNDDNNTCQVAYIN